MSSAAMVRVVRKVAMDSRDSSAEEDGEVGSFRGKRMPVRGIFHSDSGSLAPMVVEYSPSSSSVVVVGCGVSTLRSVLSSPMPVAMTGREPDTRLMQSLHMALMISSSTITRQRAFSPARLASISSNNCVY